MLKAGLLGCGNICGAYLRNNAVFRHLRIVKCGLCAKACPFGFFPPESAADGVFLDPDCMHCRRCVERCPKHALSLESMICTDGKTDAAENAEQKN